MFSDAHDMLKLEKIEFGGIKGKSFSDQVLALFEEFNTLFKSISDLSYDPLDPADPVGFQFHVYVFEYMNFF